MNGGIPVEQPPADEQAPNDSASNAASDSPSGASDARPIESIEVESSQEADAQTAVPSPLSAESGSPSSSPFRGRVWVKRIVSAWLLYHVLAIIVAPASVAPSSGLMQTCWRAFRPYLQVLYLNHGYHFFAPEPSSSTLVGYSLEFPDGGSEVGRFPHRGIAPRLLYHRHFMLTEFLGFVDDAEEQPWHRSYARHLGKSAGAERVSLSRITHYLPTQESVREGATLNESESFTEVPLGSYRCDDL